MNGSRYFGGIVVYFKKKSLENLATDLVIGYFSSTTEYFLVADRVNDWRKHNWFNFGTWITTALFYGDKIFSR